MVGQFGDEGRFRFWVPVFLSAEGVDNIRSMTCLGLGFPGPHQKLEAHFLAVFLALAMASLQEALSHWSPGANRK